MKICLLFILLFWGLDTVAQTSLIDHLHEMQINPRLKEKVYVHTNKTSYFTDDVIWFKAYVGDSINFPSVRTKILEVRLFDDQGNPIFSRKVRIESGVGSGQFELSNSVAPGTYYLQARTNYMRNFGEDHQYLKEVTVLGKRLPNRSKARQEYDIQIFPEGGHLVEEVDNVVGIKALLNGNGVDFEGVIIDKNGKTKTTFNSAHNGMGRCQFKYERNQEYTARIKVRDSILKVTLPKALAKGVALHVDSRDPKKLQVYLKTNEDTFYDQVYSNYKLLYRQDRQIFGLVSVDRLDSLTAFVETAKSIFLDGVHTVTLFAEDRPIAERKFFIETERKKTSVSLKQQAIDTDSIKYQLGLTGIKGLRADVSISILPASSKALDQKNSIQSAFLLQPFVKGHIEDPAYYFNTDNKKRKEHLDLLLLTQGWTQYSLDDIIKEINPDEKYTFEEGFELKGSLNEETKYKNLVLIPDDLRVVDKIKLNGQPNFSFQNLKVFKGDTVHVAYQNWLGKIVKPSAIKYDSLKVEDITKLNVRPLYEYKDSLEEVHSSTVEASEGNVIENNPRPIDDPNAINLEEVIVEERRRNERYFERRKIIEKYKPIVRDIGRYREISISEVFEEHDLLSFLKLAEGARLNGDNPLNIHLQDAKRNRAFLMINGRFIDANELITTNISIKNIAHVMTNTEIKVINGVIIPITFYQVFTTDDYRNNTKTLFYKHIIQNGYDRPKKYYSPLYDFNQERPINLSEIDWKPQLKTDKNGTVFFKIPRNESIDKVLFSIQGFSDAGHLISETIIK